MEDQVEWSNHTFICQFCRRRSRIAVETLAYVREEYELGNDSEAADFMEICLSCMGQPAEGEHAIPEELL